MFLLLAFVAFVAIVASCWFGGLWSTLLTLVNLLLAAMIATNFYEPAADYLDGIEPTFTYVYDFVCIWLLFLGSFAILRVGTALLSMYRVKFDIYTEMIGRPLVAMCLAGIFISFATFTIHLAPLTVSPFGFQREPDTVNLIIGPDNIWHGYIQYSSRYPMSAAREAWFLPEYDAPESEDDAARNCRVFDSTNIFIYKYHHRRADLSEASSLLIKSGSEFE